MKSEKKDIKQVQPTPLAISAAIDEAPFLKDLVEKLAYRRADPGYSYELMPRGCKAIETSSLEAFVSGTLHVAGDGNFIQMPFVSCFLFTCIKTRKGEYTLSWSSSLS